MIDPLLFLALALFTAFVLGRASARATWRRVREERLYLAGFQVLAERWRQTAAPLVADWPAELPAGNGVRELTTRAASTAATPAAEDTGPVRWPVAVGRHRRHVWVGFWAASVTPRDPQARIAAAMQRADSAALARLPEETRVFAEVLAPTYALARELIGVGT